MVNYHINEEGGERTLTEVNKHSEGLLVQADVSKSDEIKKLTEDEIADAFIFLAKNDAMTGQVIYIDAGFTLK